MRKPTGSDGAGGACVVGAWVTGACVAGLSIGGAWVMGAALAEGSGVASVVVVAVRVDSVSVVEALPMVVSIATELSISIATTSDGDEPHDEATNNIEMPRLGPINRERCGFTAKE